jgi:excisionase family DNA binding protein
VIVWLLKVGYSQDRLTKEEMGRDMGNGEHMSNMLTVREVARLLHVHPNTLRRWSNNGRIKAYRITSRGDRRFKREEIARFFAELSSQADSSQKAQIRH